jgi:hypothetical protein
VPTRKNDQAFVEQKNGAVVRRLMGYGRFEGVETARVMARLYAAARLYVNFFQPSFKLKEKRREGAKVIKRYHPPSTPCERALAHPKVAAAVKQRLRDQYRTLDPVALLAEIRAVRKSSAIASIAVPEMRAARATRSSRCDHQRRARPLLRRRSRTAIRVPRTGDRSELIRRGFACLPSSTSTLVRSGTGLLRSRS